jgi:hypothetical protein
MSALDDTLRNLGFTTKVEYLPPHEPDPDDIAKALDFYEKALDLPPMEKTVAATVVQIGSAEKGDAVIIGEPAHE